MPKQTMYALFDTRNSSFQPPFVASAEGEAVRGVILGLRKGVALFAQFPMEFSLFEVGSFDFSSGELASHIPPRHVTNVGSLVEAAKKEGE